MGAYTLSTWNGSGHQYRIVKRTDDYDLLQYSLYEDGAIIEEREYSFTKSDIDDADIVREWHGEYR